jgi:glycosyltransferase involved in cell wall biosynthesis
MCRTHAIVGRPAILTVWCSEKDNAEHSSQFASANLRYVNLRANGVQSIPYDTISLWQAVRSGYDRILLLGVSAALALPIIRMVSRTRTITNIDGMEWEREKWNAAARAFLRLSEWAAVRFSHAVIADNQAIADYVQDRYGSMCHVIAYGGDHAIDVVDTDQTRDALPEQYALALCRIEPENNIHTILQAWSSFHQPLVFVGNWASSAYGRELKARFERQAHLHLMDPVYAAGALHALRARATLYVHGHSAGGTNPSLVEMMHFGIPVLAHGCSFNRHTTEDRALYFETAEDLLQVAQNLTPECATRVGGAMREIAQRRYTWNKVAREYSNLLETI